MHDLIHKSNVDRRTGALRGHADGVDEPEGRSLYDHLKMLREALKSHPKDGIDYNHLSSDAKQAAQALVESDEARFREIDGRTKLVAHKPRMLLQLITMDAYA